uniref:Uncharacterized protein n=1 Tax=Arundo donax TaxID=35708 RepID=A0A0A8Z0D8_ARUDO
MEVACLSTTFPVNL